MAFSCTCYKSLSIQQTVSYLHRLGLLGSLRSKNSQWWEQGSQWQMVALRWSDHLSLTSGHTPFLSGLPGILPHCPPGFCHLPETLAFPSHTGPSLPTLPTTPCDSYLFLAPHFSLLLLRPSQSFLSIKNKSCSLFISWERDPHADTV